MLGDFFRINMPYGIRRNEANEWYAFNREYVPIGFNDDGDRQKFKSLNLPIYTQYKGLTETKLLAVAWDPVRGVERAEDGKIMAVWLYNDGTNPMNQSTDQPGLWTAYFNKIKILSKLVENND